MSIKNAGEIVSVAVEERDAKIAALESQLAQARASERAAGERADKMERLAAMAQRFFDGEWYVEPYKGGWWVWRMRGIEDAEFLSGSIDRLYPSRDAAFAALAAARAKEGER